MKTTNAQITSSTFTASSDFVTLSLDSEALQALNAAIESGSESACAIIMVSDDHENA
jgi:hypothetical protein